MGGVGIAAGLSGGMFGGLMIEALAGLTGRLLIEAGGRPLGGVSRGALRGLLDGELAMRIEEVELVGRDFVPVKFPAEAVEDGFEEFAAVDVEHGALAGDKTFDVAFAEGGEAVGSGVGLATGAVSRDDEPRVDDGADERRALVDILGAAFVWMEGELELVVEELFDHDDVAGELRFLRERHDDIEVVDVASVVGIAEVVDDETVELIEEDVGEELAGEIADDNTVAGLTVKETLVWR